MLCRVIVFSGMFCSFSLCSFFFFFFFNDPAPTEIYTLSLHDALPISLGERMKCELVASLLHRPPLLFLDEPTLGLDVTAQDAIRRFLIEYREQHRRAKIGRAHV